MDRLLEHCWNVGFILDCLIDRLRCLWLVYHFKLSARTIRDWNEFLNFNVFIIFLTAFRFNLGLLNFAAKNTLRLSILIFTRRFKSKSFDYNWLEILNFWKNLFLIAFCGNEFSRVLLSRNQNWNWIYRSFYEWNAHLIIISSVTASFLRLCFVNVLVYRQLSLETHDEHQVVLKIAREFTRYDNWQELRACLQSLPWN